MTFINDLYHDEIRDGYLVKADMKKVWNRQLEMWQEVDRICRKHNITYWAAYGTLLGAARHKGYIPWDEDLDLWMMRPDYNRFFDVINDELKGKLVAVNFKNMFMTKLAHTRTTLIASDSEENRPLGLMIDIFPLDIIDEGTSESFNAFNALKEVFFATYYYSKITDHLQRGGYIFNELSFLKSIAEIPNEQDRYKFACLYANELFEQSSVVSWSGDSFSNRKLPMKKDWFRETIYLPFETVELPAPKMFDKVLTSYYGDWRTPVNDGQNRVGYIYSADIPWQDILRQLDLRFLKKYDSEERV